MSFLVILICPYMTLLRVLLHTFPAFLIFPVHNPHIALCGATQQYLCFLISCFSLDFSILSYTVSIPLNFGQYQHHVFKYLKYKGNGPSSPRRAHAVRAPMGHVVPCRKGFLFVE